MENYLADHLAYHLDEAETFKELQKTRETVKLTYMKLDKALQQKKDALFKKGDIYKWGGFSDNLEA